MSYEITRRGFLALVAVLAGTAILPNEAIAEPTNPDHTRVYRFSWAIEREGIIVEEFREEDGMPIGFEVNIGTVEDSDPFSPNPCRHFVLRRKEVTLKLWGEEYLVPKMRVDWREEEDRTVFVMVDPIAYDPAYDRIVYAIGRDDPMIVQGLRG